MRLLFVVNDAAFFLSHRGLLADAAADAGHDVHVACPSEPAARALVARGFTHHPLRLDRGGRSPLQEARTALDILRLYRRVRPDIAHLITIKPVLYGGAVARIARVPGVVFAISGLGYAFLARGLRARVERSLVLAAYRFALRHRRSRLIVQNPDDRALFVDRGLVQPEHIALVRGNGIDLGEFTVRPEPAGPPLVVLPARMLWDKGVGEFVEAARTLRARGVHARFALVGSSGSANPTVVAASQLEAWRQEGVVEYWGHRTDMPEVLASASIVCLPSYREGIPRALIEAAASGRPIVTTDVPGCREVVRDGENGFLVPAREAKSLAAALEKLIADATLRHAMGARGRSIVEAEMSASVTVGRVLDIYAQLAPAPLSGSRQSAARAAEGAQVRRRPAA